MYKKTHGHTHGGGKMSPTYVSWTSMKQRCYNKNHIAYEKYGGRGITVCDRWKNSFQNFLDDMGIRPENKSLERLDNNGNYEPKNCCWASIKEQARNRRNTILININGKRLTLDEACSEVGLSYSTVMTRVYNGWTLEQALGLENRWKDPSTIDLTDCKKNRDKIRKCYLNGCRVTEIAKFLGMHRAAVSASIHYKYEKKLKK